MAGRLPPFSTLRAFEAAARLGSFKLAAHELAVTATAISHRIRVLEEHLERPLFERKVRAVALTADGRTLHAAVSSGLHTIVAAMEQLRQPDRSTVTLSTTPAFATKWLVPRLGAFQAEHPGIDLYIHTSNTPVDLEAGNVDLAIRYGHGQYPGVTAALLMEDSFAPVASPALANGLGTAVPKWPLIHFDWHRAPPADLTWQAWARAAACEAMRPFDTGIRYSEEIHAIQAAVAGQGVALLSLLLVEQELRQGLLQVLANPALPAMSYHLVKPGQRRQTQAAGVVEAWLLSLVNRPAA